MDHCFEYEKISIIIHSTCIMIKTYLHDRGMILQDMCILIEYIYITYTIRIIFMVILGDYDACYHSLMNFLHCYAISLKSIFMHNLGLIMCFMNV